MLPRGSRRPLTILLHTTRINLAEEPTPAASRLRTPTSSGGTTRSGARKAKSALCSSLGSCALCSITLWRQGELHFYTRAIAATIINAGLLKRTADGIEFPYEAVHVDFILRAA